MCVAEEVDPNYVSIIDEFENKFNYLYDTKKLNMTLKTHVIIHHYKDYFELSGKTFKYTNAEFTESLHSSLRKHEEISLGSLLLQTLEFGNLQSVVNLQITSIKRRF